MPHSRRVALFAHRATVAAFFFDLTERVLRHIVVFMLLIVFPMLAISGQLFSHFGLPMLLRDDPAFSRRLADMKIEGVGDLYVIGMAYLFSPTMVVHWLTTFFTGMFWLLAAIMGDRTDTRFSRMPIWLELRYLAVRTLPIAGLLLWLSSLQLEGRPPASPGEIVRAFVGVGLGAVAIVLISALSRSISAMLRVHRHYVLLGMLFLFVVTLRFAPTLLPIVSIYKLMLTITGIYVFLLLFPVGWRKAIVVATLAIGASSHAVVHLLNSEYSSFKYKFRGMEQIYADPVRLIQRTGGLREQASPGTVHGKSIPAPPALLLPEDALRNFAARMRRNGRPLGRRLVVVATSGGAYRATYWTALVLDRIRAMSTDGRAPEIAHHIRMLTGASGGMVGAAYFASAALANTLDNPADNLLVGAIDGDINAGQQESLGEALAPWATPRDSLSAVFRQLAFTDLLHIAWPGDLSGPNGEPPTDRGRVLQRHWKQLKMSFKELSASVASGGAPSLILSPMIVETGQPLLISDLDLREVASARTSEIATARNHTLEFFKIFPQAYDSFSVRTAVRMNATFPLISPSVDLPTEPPRRVGDAGYFDNYGMANVIQYLSRPEVRQWQRDNHMDGALIIQINAFPVLQEVPVEAARNDCPDVGPQEEDTRWLEWLTTPFVGVAAGLDRSMIHRGEQSLVTLRELYQKDGLELNRVPFENSSRAMMSWYLPDHELECMRHNLDAANNKQAFAAIEKLWKTQRTARR